MAVLATYKPPYKGLDTSIPADSLDPAATPHLLNAMLREGVLGTRYNYNTTLQSPPPDNSFIILFGSFLDINGKPHTVAAHADGNFYDYTSGAWHLKGTFPAVTGYTPSYHTILGGVLYFVTGPSQISSSSIDVYSYDGSTLVGVDGGVFGAYYVFELAGSVVIANTVEVVSGIQTNFGNRVRWCVSGNPTQWNISSFKGAGFYDLLDTPDFITGYILIGNYCLVLRKNGITQMTPTGVGTSAFSFNHLWASDMGIGNYYPFAAASYGASGFILGEENAYAVTTGSFKPIGDRVREQMYAELEQNLSQPFGNVMAWIAPRRWRDYLYLCWEICIPSNAGGCYIYDYVIKEDQWLRHISTKFTPTAFGGYGLNYNGIIHN